MCIRMCVYVCPFLYFYTHMYKTICFHIKVQNKYFPSIIVNMTSSLLVCIVGLEPNISDKGVFSLAPKNFFIN